MAGSADVLVRLPASGGRGEGAGHRWRLVACPPSGAGAQYFRALSAPGAGAPQVWSARYPGRESRLGEPCASRVGPLAQEICGALVPMLVADDLPTVLLGHSMGVGVAVDVAVEVERRLPGRLTLLALSARDWTGPDAQGRAAQEGRDAEVRAVTSTDAALARWLSDLGGTPQVLLDDESFMAMQLPILRADLLASLAYEPPAPRSLTTPMLLLCGDADPVVSPADMQGWASLTTGPVSAVSLRGGHDAVITDAGALLGAVAQALSV